MKIQDGHVVLIDYKLSSGDGTLLDQSPEGQPLVYLHGAAGILPALETHLSGKQAGYVFDSTFAPGEAYGEYRPDAVKLLPRSQVPPGVELQVGMQVKNSAGGQIPAVVVAISDDYVTLDSNHPLAGLTLRFRGSVVAVRNPTDEELAAIAEFTAD